MPVKKIYVVCSNVAEFSKFLTSTQHIGYNNIERLSRLKDAVALPFEGKSSDGLSEIEVFVTGSTWSENLEVISVMKELRLKKIPVTYEASSMDDLERVMIETIRRVRLKAELTGKREGEIICPCCGGPMQFAIVGPKGHTHAKCNNPLSRNCLEIHQ